MKISFYLLITVLIIYTNAKIFFRNPFLPIDLNSRKVESMLKLRAGHPNEQFIWYYSGLIRNPLTGGEVVGIEGLEMTRAVDNEDTIGFKSYFNSSDLTTTGSNSNPILFQKSFLSRKVFIYTLNGNRSEAIRSYRIKPISPKREISSPIKILQELVTFGTFTSGKMFAMIELPGGRLIRSGDLSISGSVSPFDWLPWSRTRLELKCFLSAKRKRPIGKWVSFASASDNSGRSQEYHSLSQHGHGQGVAALDNRPSLVCKRFGECPAWFAPGKSCATELDAIRFDSLKDVPKEKLRLFRRECPEFFVVPLSVRTFNNGSDPLERFKPWYLRLLQLSRLRRW